MKEEVKTEMDQLRAELRRRPAQMMVYPAPLEDRVKLTFAGNKWENSMEFLVNCEKKMEKILSNIDENEKINFLFTISQIQQHSCTLSYVIMSLHINNSVTRLKIGIGLSLIHI